MTMKKILTCFFSILLMVIGMVSCQKDEQVSGKIRARLERCHNEDSKVSFDLTNGFRWQSGDQIRVCRTTSSGSNQVYTYTIDETSVENQADYADFSLSSGTNATTSDGTGYYHAYYPASIRSTLTDMAENVRITIPNTQTLTSDGKMQEIPMYAQSGNLEFSFKNLCGILCLHLEGSNEDMVSSIIIKTDDSHPIAGVFNMQDANTQAPYITAAHEGVSSPESYVTINCPSSGLGIGGSGRDFCIYLPTGDYPHMEITLTSTSGKMCKKVFDGGGSSNAPAAINIARSCYTPINFSNLEFKTVHLFSIGLHSTVVFSPANLQYDISNNEYRFAGNDYDYRGSANVTNLNNNSGVIDLFGWGTGAAPTTNSTDVADYPTTFVDWGNNQIKSADGGTIYAANTWRTLTQAEWQYLLSERSASMVNSSRDARFAKARVNGKKGLIIFPDNYVHPEGVTWPLYINIADRDYGLTSNDYTDDEWAAMKAAGAVFLPAAGFIGDDRAYSFDNTNGYYWSSTIHPTNNSLAFYLYFRLQAIDINTGRARQRGCSVRLVHDF